ncbi:MAG: transporter [Alphaproteobacteria bacterium]
MKNGSFFVIYTAALLCVSPAHATFNVSSPGIKKGIAEIESRNRYDVDDSASRDGRAINAIKMVYGVTDYFAVEFQGDWQDNPTSGYFYDSSEVEGKFRFFEPDAYWLDFALKLAYEWNHEPDSAEAMEAKFLFSKKLSDITVMQNTNFSKEVGTDASADTTLSTSWQARYKISPLFQPSIEVYNSFGEISDMQGYEEQSHRIGPVLHGELTESLKFQLGYLIAASDAAEDGSFKFFLDYEFPL